MTSWDEAKGKAEEAAGRAMNDPDTEAEGKKDQAKGKLGEALDDAKDAAKKAVGQ